MKRLELERWAALSDNLGELTDADVLVEVSAKPEAEAAREVVMTQPVLEAVQASYRALGGPGSLHFETVAVLEQVDKRRVRLWLRARSEEGGSDGTLDSALLTFLARGTLTILSWLNESKTLELGDLHRALRVLVEGTLPPARVDSARAGSADLMKAVAAWREAMKSLRQASAARVTMPHGSAELDLSKELPDAAEAVPDRTIESAASERILIVEQPDYRSTGQWQLRHGQTQIAASCERGTLLDRFYTRDLDIRPGDALRCRLRSEVSYGPDHELLAETFTIVELIEVLTPSAAPIDAPLPVQQAPLAQDNQPDEPEAAPEVVPQEGEVLQEIQGDFGVLTLRRLPID